MKQAGLSTLSATLGPSGSYRQARSLGRPGYQILHVTAGKASVLLERLATMVAGSCSGVPRDSGGWCGVWTVNCIQVVIVYIYAVIMYLYGCTVSYISSCTGNFRLVFISIVTHVQILAIRYQIQIFQNIDCGPILHRPSLAKCMASNHPASFFRCCFSTTQHVCTHCYQVLLFWTGRHMLIKPELYWTDKTPMKSSGETLPDK